MRKYFLLFVAVAVSAVCVFGQRKTNEVPAHKKLAMAQGIIENFYVDDVDADTLVEEAIKAMLKTLDPHSAYSSPDETKALDEPLQGNFSGIGVTFNNTNDTVFIIQPTSGGPAERVGILPGDRIIYVDDVAVSGVKMPKNDIMKRIRGPKGSEVKITVERRGEPTLLAFKIIRDDIPLYSVDAAYMIDDVNGYIRVSRFAEDTPDEFMKALQRLKKQGMENLVIDLQDNGGGYLIAATDLAEMFLNRGDKVLFTQSSRTQPRHYEVSSTGPMTKGRVVILVNQYSASASEILSGALQDNDRALVVGRRTFGKGLVQRPFRFDDGSMVRLTISRYYTPSGRCIQKPYTKGNDESYREDIADRFNHGELMNVDSVRLDSTQVYHTRAGRVVYGGGGIMPDRFVPLDTTYFTKYYRNLVAKSVLLKYTLGYYDKNQQKLKKEYKNVDEYVNRFKVDDRMLKDLVALAKEEGVEFDKEEYKTSLPYIKAYVKALIGQDLFDSEAMYRVMNPLNPVYNAGVELLRSPGEYEKLLKPTP